MCFLDHKAQGCSISVTKMKPFGFGSGLLPDDLLCEALFSILFTVLILPMHAEDSLEIYLQDPLTLGLNLYKNL